MLYKRYQYWTKDGLRWTQWFKVIGTTLVKEKWQLKNKLLNEYQER